MVTTMFVGSLIAVVGGVIVVGAALAIVLATGTLVMDGPDVTSFEPSSMTPVAIGLGLLGVLAIIGGSLGQFVAWIGAVVNTARLADKTWFVVLLVLGLLSFGFIAMLVYVLAGPDGTAPRPAPPANSNRSPVTA
jgi:hypothetical protein